MDMYKIVLPNCIIPMLTETMILSCCRVVTTYNGEKATIHCSNDTMLKLRWDAPTTFNHYNIVIDENEIDLLIK